MLNWLIDLFPRPYIKVKSKHGGSCVTENYEDEDFTYSIVWMRPAEHKKLTEFTGW